MSLSVWRYTWYTIFLDQLWKTMASRSLIKHPLRGGGPTFFIRDPHDRRNMQTWKITADNLKYQGGFWVRVALIKGERIRGTLQPGGWLSTDQNATFQVPDEGIEQHLLDLTTTIVEALQLATVQCARHLTRQSRGQADCCRSCPQQLICLMNH